MCGCVVPTGMENEALFLFSLLETTFLLISVVLG